LSQGAASKTDARPTDEKITNKEAANLFKRMEDELDDVNQIDDMIEF
jgi:hypothetical protein